LGYARVPFNLRSGRARIDYLGAHDYSWLKVLLGEFLRFEGRRWRELVEDREGGTRQRHTVGKAVLRNVGGNRPDVDSELEVLAAHGEDFPSPLSGEEHQPESGSRESPFVLESRPQSSDLVHSQYAEACSLPHRTDKAVGRIALDEVHRETPAVHREEESVRAIGLDPGAAVDDLLENRAKLGSPDGPRGLGSEKREKALSYAPFILAPAPLAESGVAVEKIARELGEGRGAAFVDLPSTRVSSQGRFGQRLSSEGTGLGEPENGILSEGVAPESPSAAVEDGEALSARGAHPHAEAR
jgi:hypothetical protein